MKVCNMGMFDNNRHFWMGELKGFLNFYPQFEHSHIQDFYTILFINNADGEIIIDNEKIEIEEFSEWSFKTGQNECQFSSAIFHCFVRQ